MGIRWPLWIFYGPMESPCSTIIHWLVDSPTGLKWLDVGCGSGALSKAVINNHEPAEIAAIDQSEGFVAKAQKQLGSLARCRVGNALALPLEDSSVDITVSGLVLNFISEPERALDEMRRVTVPGGTVALYVWVTLERWNFSIYFGTSQPNWIQKHPNCMLHILIPIKLKDTQFHSQTPKTLYLKWIIFVCLSFCNILFQKTNQL